MALQTFTDPDGVSWRVWDVERSAASAHLMNAEFRTGWLVFEREDEQERRRLAQVPEDWASLGPARLNELRELAIVVNVTPRTGTASQARPDAPPPAESRKR